MLKQLIFYTDSYIVLTPFYKVMNKKEPKTAKDFHDFCIDLAKNYLNNLVVVDLNLGTLSELKAALQKEKKRFDTEKGFFIQKRRRVDKLIKYLKVWDLSQAGVKDDNILMEVLTDEEKKRGGEERDVRNWRDNAEANIKSAEKGIFPK